MKRIQDSISAYNDERDVAVIEDIINRIMSNNVYISMWKYYDEVDVLTLVGIDNSSSYLNILFDAEVCWKIYSIPYNHLWVIDKISIEDFKNKYK